MCAAIFQDGRRRRLGSLKSALIRPFIARLWRNLVHTLRKSYQVTSINSKNPLTVVVTGHHRSKTAKITKGKGVMKLAHFLFRRG
jgi:hypothetical protein